MDVISKRKPIVNAVIVTFNSKIDRLRKLLIALSPQVTKLIIVDNGSKNQQEISKLLGRFENATLLRISKNVGLGAAQNVGVEFALRSKNLDWVLTIDDDTLIKRDAVKTALKHVPPKTDIGLIWLANNKINYGREENLFEITYAINSADLVNPSVYKKVRYREEFIIDFIDMDFSYNVRKAGFKIVRHSDKLINHNIGKTAVINGERLTYESPQRIYYGVRNAIILFREGKFPAYNLGAHIFHILKSSFYATPKNGVLPTIKAILFGTTDGLLKRTGWCQHNIAI